MGLLIDYLNVQFFNGGSGAKIDMEISNVIYDFAVWDNRWHFEYKVNNDYTFVFIPWLQGGIGYGAVPSGYDLLSAKFSGCYMARYIDSNPNIISGAHIHIGTETSYNQTNRWNDFSISNNISGSLFKPDPFLDGKLKIFEKYHLTSPEDMQTWGIISSNGNCYSVLVYKLEGVWRIETIEENTPLCNMIIP